MSETTTLVTPGAPGAVGRSRLLVLIDGAPVSVPLPEAGAVVIGRSERCDVRIDHPSISRSHAVLDLSGGMTLADLGSANGTRIGEVDLAPDTPVPLAHDEIATLGSVSIVVQRRAEPVRARRLWQHDYIDGRLSEECARAARTRASFALLHVVASGASDDDAKLALADALRDLDVVGRYARGRYAVIAIGAAMAEAERVRAQLIAAFEARGVRASVGVAVYPEDGRDAAALASVAASAAGSGAPPDAPPAVTRAGMQAVYRLADRVATGAINVLVVGETGVGKQVLAERIHRASPRAGGPFVQLNCAAISESLLESELFGHEAGAFTGATSTKPGLLETAGGGTAFLDEIGDMPLGLQAKLLRVLENGEVMRVGGLAPRPIDVRFVAATNRDLEAEVERGAFRQDLYFRLAGVTLVIPPLRERPDEVAALAEAFIAHYAAEREPAPTLGADALAMLRAYSWPGNVRELRNAIERACLLCDGDIIEVMHLPAATMAATYATTVIAGPPAAIAPGQPARTPRRKVDDEARRRAILDALRRTGGNNTEAARLLGVSRRTLGKWCDQYGVARPRKRR